MPKLKFEINIVALFSGLKLPEEGMTKAWLTDIKRLRELVATATTKKQRQLIKSEILNLKGDDVGTWAISKQLVDLLDVMDDIEHHIQSHDIPYTISFNVH